MINLIIEEYEIMSDYIHPNLQILLESYLKHITFMFKCIISNHLIDVIERGYFLKQY